MNVLILTDQIVNAPFHRDYCILQCNRIQIDDDGLTK